MGSEPHNPFYRILEYIDTKHEDCQNDTGSYVLEECTEWVYDDPTSFVAEVSPTPMYVLCVCVVMGGTRLLGIIRMRQIKRPSDQRSGGD